MTVPAFRDVVRGMDSSQTPGGGPSFKDIVGGMDSTSPTFQQAVQQPDTGDQAPDLGTATGRAQQEEYDVAVQQQVFTQLINDPSTSPEQRQRLQHLLDRMQTLKLGPIELTNRVTTQRSDLSNFARGTLHGLVNYGYFGALDLATAAAQIVLPKSIEKVAGLPALREHIAESQQVLKEMFDPQGKAGFAGVGVGAIAGPAAVARVGALAGLGNASRALEPFAVLNSAGLRALARISPSAASILARGVQPGATYFQRLSANLVGAGAVDAVQYTDIVSRDDLTTEQKIQSLAATAIISAGTAGITAIRAVKPTPAEIETVKSGLPVDAAPEAPATQRVAEAERLANAATENMQRVNARRKMTKAARAAWEAANPEGVWKDLPKEVRDGVVETFTQLAARTNLGKTQAPTEPAAPAPAPAPAPAAASSVEAGHTILRSGGSFDPNDPASAQQALAQIAAKLSDRTTPLRDRAKLLADRAALERVLTRPATPPPSPNPTQSTTGEPPLKVTGERVVPQPAQPEAPVVSDVPEIGKAATLPPAEKDVFINQLIEQNAQLTQQRNEAQRLAETDELTGLANQRAWLRAVDKANADPTQEIALFDLKNVKAMNDLVSMEEGNSYIVDAARALETATASTNSPLRVFRIGGDEFGLIVPKGKGEQIISIARQILGESSVGDGYQTGFRGVVGITTTEAEAAMNAAKAGESAPKYRKLRGVAAGSKERPPKESFYGVPLKKALDAMSEQELETLTNKLDTKVENGQISNEDYTDALLQIKAADDARIAREAAKRQTPQPEINAPAVDEPVVTDAGPSFSEPATVVRPRVAERQVMEAGKFRELVRAKPKTLSTEDLVAIRDELDTRLRAMDRLTAKDSGYLPILARMNDEIAARSAPKSVTLYMRPEVVGAVIGMSAGMMDPQNEEQQQLQNALYVLAATLIAGPQVLRRLKTVKDQTLPEYQQNIRKQVKSVEDGALDQRQGIYTRLMRWYENVARRDLPITNVTKLTGGRDLPAGRNPGKRAEIFGLFRQITDDWLGIAHGRGVGYWTNDGEFVKLDALTISEIAQLVDGDLRSVGDLAAAKRELELRQRTNPKTLGLSLSDARDMYAHGTEAQHQAATELTKYFRAMAQTSVASGLLSEDLFKQFQADAFYVAARRLFHNEPGTQSSTVSTRGRSKSSSGPEQLFRRLTGSRRPIQNPAEAAIDLTGRYMKANELNRLATVFFDHLEAVDPEIRKGIATRLTRAETPEIDAQAARIAEIKTELSQVGPTISNDEALAIASALSDESLNITSDVVRLFRNGKMEAWRVSDPVARAFRSLQPYELEMVMEGAGLATKPTQIARVGITANPIFIGRQAFRDIWQFFINGTYGVSPESSLLTKTLQAPLGLAESGIGSVRGWLAQMFRTGEYRNFVSAGAGGESVASQGLRVVRGSIRESTNLLGKIREPQTKTQFGQIIKEMRQMHWREAYASIMEPIANAGRLGAYLKERGRGADVLEAVWRAKKAGANFNNRGSLAAIRALDRMTLFLNPSIQGLDASRYAFMKDPTGYIIRGIAGITIPSMLFWMTYKDDDELDQLRRTEDGKRYWFMRMNGNIVKLPKPIFDGQVFGATAESWLDHKYKQDPTAVSSWMNSMYNDMSLNLLPFIGVVPITLMTGKITAFGSNLVPESAQGLDLEYQAGPNASYLSRLISEATAPNLRKFGLQGSPAGTAFTPAGLDFIASQFLGSGGGEAYQALSTAIEYGKTGEFPAKEELPFVRGVLAKYPTTNVAAIQEFYSTADQYESAINTVNFLARTDPARLDMYLEQRQQDILIGKTIIDARAQISQLAKAIHDIRYASRDLLTPDDRRLYEQEFVKVMIDVAKSVNEVTRELRKDNK